MGLATQQATRAEAVQPSVVLVTIVSAAIAATLVVGAFVWTSPGTSPATQTGNQLLDPALIQVRADERASGTTPGAVPLNRYADPALIDVREDERASQTGVSGYVPDPPLVLLRKGEQARRDRIAAERNAQVNAARMDAGNGPLAADD